jgi:hypothetical protein
MQVGWRADADNIHAIAGDQLLPGVENVGQPVTLGYGARSLRVG